MELKEIANDNIEAIFDHVGIDFTLNYSYSADLRAKCPFHEGKNPTSFSYSKNSKQWMCFSQGCHKGHGDIFGMIRLFKKQQGIFLNFGQSIEYVAQLLGYNLKTDMTPEEVLENENKLVLYRLLRERKKELVHSKKKEFPIAIERLQNRKFYSKYFADLGFTEATMQKFFIGECHDFGKPMSNRAYSLIISEDGKECLGVTGRTLFGLCNQCEYFHNPNSQCPLDNPEVITESKWLHYGFVKNNILYNINNAKKSIQETGVCILTEGAKETWWLDQNQMHNVVSLLGLTMSKEQKKILLRNNCRVLVLGLDNDEEGNNASEEIAKELGHVFKVYKIQDFGKNYTDLDDIKDEAIVNLRVKIKEIENNAKINC